MNKKWQSIGNGLLLVAFPGIIHIGAHFLRAVEQLRIRTRLCDPTTAFEGPWWLRKFNWWARGHRPSRLREFSRQIVKACQEFQPSWMLSTGLAPVEAWALTEIGGLGVRRLNYLTDDPWNPAHNAPWFFDALTSYDHVFSLRRSNLDDLARLGCPKVSYLPFAYAPELHYPEPTTAEERSRFDCDLVFAGGADQDRVSYIAALIRAGFSVALYGGYWDRYSETKAHARGDADPRTLRLAIGGAKVALCLVRRANRDGNSMRTFEVPAIGACMLTEYTEEHREIFGNDGKAVVYFRTIEEMIEKLRWLLDHDEERQRLAQAAHHLIVNGGNTYKDRLVVMMGA